MDTKLVACIFVFCVVFHCPSLGQPPKKFAGSPVILVPGDGGSQFEAKLDKKSVPHIWCRKVYDWFPIWLNIELMGPWVVDCLVDNMRLVYNETDRTTQNSPGVQIRQSHFGNTTGVEYLDSSQISFTSYYHDIVQALVAKGYTRNVNIRGAPYDFRKAPNEMQGFIKDLTLLVEDTYRINQNKPVIMIGHSMGNPYLLNMLNKQNDQWRKKYIKTYISLASPWGGAAKTLRLMSSGDNLGVFVVNPLTARPEQRSMPSTAWLLPYDTFWNDTEILVTSPTTNYTVKDYKQFFNDIKFPVGYMMREDTEPYGLRQLTAPGVEVHCLHGVNVSTPASFHYSKKQWPDDQPDTVMGNGDGTVNLRSLHGCLRWKGKNKGKEVLHKTFSGVDHMNILSDKDAIAYITEVAYS